MENNFKLPEGCSFNFTKETGAASMGWGRWDEAVSPTSENYIVRANAMEAEIRADGKPVAFKKDGKWTIIDAEKAIEQLLNVIHKVN